MATEIIEYRYPYNPEGNNPECHIDKEEKQINAVNINYRFVLPNQAPFFKEGLIVYSISEKRNLVLDTDFILTHRFKSASEVLKRDIYGSLTLINNDILGTLLLSYSTLGGVYSNRDLETLAGLSGIMVGRRYVDWEDIVDVPDEFPPYYHKHDVKDINDIDKLIEAIDGITDVLSGETHPNHKHPMEAIDGLLDRFDLTVSSTENVVYTPIDSIVLRDYPTVIALTYPKPNSTVVFVTEILITNNININRLLVFGSYRNDMGVGDDWKVSKVISDNDFFTKKFSGSYTERGEPILYLKRKEGDWGTVTVSVIKTIYSIPTKDLLTGEYIFEKATTLVGTPRDILYDVYRHEVEEVDNDLTKLAERVTVNEGDISNLETDLGKTKGRVTVNEGDISNLETDLKKTKDRVTTNENDISDLETDLGKTKDRVSVNENDISDLETDLGETKGRVTVNESDISKLRSDLTTTNGNVTTNKNDISKLRTDLTSTNGNVTTNKKDIAALDERVSANEDAIDGGDNSLVSRVTANEKDISKLQTDLTTTNRNVTTNKNDISKLRTDLTTTNGNVTTNKNDISKLRSDLTTTNGNVTTNKNDISKLRSDLTTTNGNVTTNRNDISKLRSDLSTTNGNVTTNKNDISRLRTDLTAVTNRVNTLESTVSTLSQTVSNLEQELKNYLRLTGGTLTGTLNTRAISTTGNISVRGRVITS